MNGDTHKGGIPDVGQPKGRIESEVNRDEQIERKWLFVFYFLFWLTLVLMTVCFYFPFWRQSASVLYNGDASLAIATLCFGFTGMAICFLRPPLRRWAIGLHTLLFLAWGLLF